MMMKNMLFLYILSIYDAFVCFSPVRITAQLAISFRVHIIHVYIF